MRKIILFFVLTLTINLSAQNLWQISKDTVITYYYMDGDEFSTGEINKDKWKSWYGWARSIVSNKEQQYYSEFKNHELKNGCLYITTEKKEAEQRLIDWMKDNDSIKNGRGVFQGYNKRQFKYQAGLIQSNRKFLKGYYECKFKAPSNKGLWPAFWLYGGSPNEEIDIMELKGERHDQTHVDTHCQGCDVVKNFIGQKKSFGGWIKLDGKLNDGFNIISALWTDTYVKYYLNGKCIAISKVKFNQPKHIVANVAVADDNGPFHPGPNKEEKNFEPFVIDYIRAWSFGTEQASQITLSKSDNVEASAKTKAKNKPKMLYGTKKDHVGEGIFVSLFSNDDGTFKVYCNGLNKDENYTVKVLSGEEKLYEKTSGLSEQLIPVEARAGLRIQITYNGKTAEKVLFTR